jgi:hypothetical protein
MQVDKQKSSSALGKERSSWHDSNRLDINCRDMVGNTALHYAAQSGLKQCVEFLVAHQADLLGGKH